MNIVFATANAVVALPGGGQVNVRAGSHWPAEDPIVQAQPSLFSDDARNGLNFSTPPAELTTRQVETVEQATAAPGERRARRG